MLCLRIDQKGVKFLAAVDEYLARQRRDRHPVGWFDSAGRWYPSESEIRECCERIRAPSRNWPYPLMLHCRTAKHVAALFAVDVRNLRLMRSARIKFELETFAWVG